MPIYEYKCLDCDVHFEKMQRVSDAPLEKCEKCGGKVEKQISLSGFQFKGEGWYITDYSKKSSGPASPTKSAAGESTSSSDSASKESKDSTKKD